jgi:hypothetical protein
MRVGELGTPNKFATLYFENFLVPYHLIFTIYYCVFRSEGSC